MNVIFHPNGSLNIKAMKDAHEYSSYNELVHSLKDAIASAYPDLSETTHDMSRNLIKQVHPGSSRCPGD